MEDILKTIVIVTIKNQIQNTFVFNANMANCAKNMNLNLMVVHHGNEYFQV